MADGSGVEIGASLDMGDIARSLATLPEMTSKEAEKAVRELTKTFDKAAREAKALKNEVRKANRSAGDSFKKLGETAGDADTAIAGVASALGLISPEAEAAARTIGDLSGGVEGLARGKEVLGTVGISVASLGTAALIATPLVIAGGIAWKHYADQAEEARVKSERLRGALNGQGKAIGVFYKALTEAETELNDLISGTSDVEKKERERITTITESAEALRSQAAAVRDAAKANLGLSEGAIAVGKAREELNRIDRQYAETLAAVNEQEQEGLDNAESIRMAAEAKANAAEREKEATAAAAASTAAMSKRAQAEQLVTAAIRDRLDPLQQINEDELTLVATLRQVGGTEEQLATIREEFGRRRADLAETEARAEADRLAAILEGIDEEQQARKAAADERAVLAEKEQQANEQLLQQAQATARNNAEATGQGISNVLSAASDGLAKLAEQAAEDGKESASGLFAAYKATAISQAVIDGALAISGIWAQFGAYPPVAAALTAGSAAITGVQIATIAAEQPSYHRGGMIGRAPDERPVNALAGEAVLNRQAARNLGAGGVAALNAGMRPQGSQTVVVEHRNRQFASALRDARRRDGSPIREHRRGGRRYAL